MCTAQDTYLSKVSEKVSQSVQGHAMVNVINRYTDCTVEEDRLQQLINLVEFNQFHNLLNMALKSKNTSISAATVLFSNYYSG